MENQRAHRRTEADVDALYREHGRALWAILYSRCCDRELATEAVQEAFLRLHERPTENVRDMLAWLASVGRNWIIDAQRSRRRSSFEPMPAADSVGCTKFAPEGVALSAEVRQQINEALQRLREEDREVLVLRYSLDWESARIAEALGTSAAAVDMRLSRARRRMAEAMAELGVRS